METKYRLLFRCFRHSSSRRSKTTAVCSPCNSQTPETADAPRLPSSTTACLVVSQTETKHAHQSLPPSTVSATRRSQESQNDTVTSNCPLAASQADHEQKKNRNKTQTGFLVDSSPLSLRNRSNLAEAPISLASERHLVARSEQAGNGTKIKVNPIKRPPAPPQSPLHSHKDTPRMMYLLWHL